ncbi:hypothetical protein EP331_03280 [bacterium]|nr:MAG: hypothetical protein EP331_03280 [bacterium]
MKKNYIFALFLTFSMLAMAASDVVLVRFNAQIQGSASNEINLTWIVSQEHDVDSYILKRKMSHQSEFVELANVQLTTGRDEIDGKVYSFLDKNVYKQNSAAEPVIYTLYSSSGGNLSYVAQVDVNYTTTTVRRTWGSIKAMFQ